MLNDDWLGVHGIKTWCAFGATSHFQNEIGLGRV